jgi:NAD(P)-dependent dehydrogenase (short-subunit alcohol dehydrogenase family)
MEGKALIVGGHSGIGLVTAGLIKVNHPKMELCIPEKEILDVRSHVEIHACVRMEGPFTHILYSAGVNELSWADNPNLDTVMYDAMEVNCFGFAVLIGEHVRQFPAHEFSAVAVSSDAGRIPMRGSLAYCVSKAALNMAVRQLARELAPSCRVNAVAPGMVDGTNMTRYIDEHIPYFRGWTPEYTAEYERQGIPTGRRATLSEVAETIEWVLMGPGQMTGAIIDINGGR